MEDHLTSFKSYLPPHNEIDFFILITTYMLTCHLTYYIKKLLF